MAKFKFTVTVHYSLWTKCTELWPLKHLFCDPNSQFLHISSNNELIWDCNVTCQQKQWWTIPLKICTPPVNDCRNISHKERKFQCITSLHQQVLCSILVKPTHIWCGCFIPVASLLQTNAYAWSFPISRKMGPFWKYVREHKCTRFCKKKGSFCWWCTRYLEKRVYFCDSQECEILEILPFLA